MQTMTDRKTSCCLRATLFLLVPALAGGASGAILAWSDNFDRASLDTNWVVLGSANASIISNELCFAQTNLDASRQVYYQPWLTCSSAWTLRWTQRFGTLDSGSLGVGVGIKNFQAEGGDDRGYNALLSGTGSSRGCMQIQRWTGTWQAPAASGPALTLAAGDIVDCSLTRSGWTLTATASNRANAQVSSTSLVFSQAAGLLAPTISRACFYPLGGTVYLDDVSFTLNHSRPARFILIGSSTAEGYNATRYDRAYVSVLQSNFTEEVCNDSASYNTTSNSASVLPEILAHEPEMAIVVVGGNDLRFGYPASQWQSNYSNLVAQLRANGVRVKYCLPTPQSVNVSALRAWIANSYPVNDQIDLWTPMVQPGGTTLNPAYDSGDGLHPNDAGHLLIGQIIISNLPPAIRGQPQSISVPAGGKAGFSVTTAGASPIAYQWQFNGGNVAAATGPSLALDKVQPTNAGEYSVIVTGMGGSVTSAVATLTVGLPHFVSVSLLPDRTPLLAFDAVSNLAYRIDASTDLVSWTPWTNVPVTNGTFQLIDPIATNVERRFYRAVWLP
jgi:lysophospholipase L1-like esterase